MNALSGNGEDALVGEEELFNGAIGGGMATKRGVAVELRSVKGGDAALPKRKQEATGEGIGKRTHMVVASP
jgi:hypothetical protein